MPNLIGAIAAFGTFKQFLGLVAASGLEQSLALGGPYTVLAPLDAELADWPPDSLTSLAAPDAAAFVVAHVLDGRVRAEALADRYRRGPIRLADGRWRLGPATLLQADLSCDNGVLHVLDRPLWPTPVPESSMG